MKLKRMNEQNEKRASEIQQFLENLTAINAKVFCVVNWKEIRFHII